jgi:hypothetical protein
VKLLWLIEGLENSPNFLKINTSDIMTDFGGEPAFFAGR